MGMPRLWQGLNSDDGMAHQEPDTTYCAVK